nr:MAG TPA: hypothetical protein [Caudoviricetes sp.]
MTPKTVHPAPSKLPHKNYLSRAPPTKICLLPPHLLLLYRDIIYTSRV